MATATQESMSAYVVTVRMPKRLKPLLKAAAQKSGLSLNQFCLRALVDDCQVELGDPQEFLQVVNPQLAETWDWPSHPDSHDGPCLCETCRSYIPEFT